MIKKEFNLSEKIMDINTVKMLRVRAVKEFIKRFLEKKEKNSLKDIGITQEQEEEIYERIVNKIQGLAGDDLI